MAFVRRVAAWLALCYELPPSPGRIASIEGLRGLAILLVFWVHFYTLFGDWAWPLLQPAGSLFYASGHAGVDLFFLLSGYLIAEIVIVRRQPLGRFLWRRAIRLWPAFLPVLFLYVLLSLAMPERSKIPAAWNEAIPLLIANALLLPGFFDFKPVITVAWSLSYEIVFYTLLAIVARVVALHRWPSRLRIMALFQFAIGYLWFCYRYGEVFYPQIHLAPGGHPRMVLFIAGMLVREFLAAGVKFRAIVLPSLLFVLGLALFGIISVPPAAFASWLPASEGIRECMNAGLLFLTFPWFAAAVISRPDGLFTWLPLRTLGNISYSFYLTHGLALQMLALLLPSPGPQHSIWFPLVLAAALTLAMFPATVLYTSVEKPFSLVRRHAARSAVAKSLA